MNVLYYVGDGLGNIVHCLPTVEALREHDLTVAVISSWPDAAKLIDHDKVVSGSIDHDGFDAVIASPTLAWVRRGDKYPFRNIARPPQSLQEVSEVEANFWMARRLGYEGPMPPGRPRHSDYRPLDEPYVVIAPGFQRAGGVWRHKAYPHWPEVAERLFDKSIPVVFIGTEDDAQPWMDKDGYHNLCGKTDLWQMTGVLAGAAVVVGVDNGPTTISAALDVPTVVLYGPTHQVKNDKHGASVVNITAPVPCRPCQFTPHMKKCPVNTCMRLIRPETVATRVLHLWGRKTEAARETKPGVPEPDLAPNPVVVLGCGRSGTNAFLEMLRMSGQFQASRFPEDKQLVQREKVPSAYLTKCDTCYFDWPSLDAFLKRNPDVKVVWTIRDPRDMALSKIYRGTPGHEGSDVETLADDATPDGCVRDLQHMVEIHKALMASEHEPRVLTVRLEDLLVDPEGTARAVCRFCGVFYQHKMLEFYKHYRQASKRRYTKLDKGQLNLWTRVNDIYGGFFRDYDFGDLWTRIEPIREYFGYDDVPFVADEAEPETVSPTTTTDLDRYLTPQWKRFLEAIRGLNPTEFVCHPVFRNTMVPAENTAYLSYAHEHIKQVWPILDAFEEHPWLRDKAKMRYGVEMSAYSEKAVFEASLLLFLVGSLAEKHIVELGGGLGGLARVLLRTEPRIGSYTIIDHPDMLRMAQAFLEGEKARLVSIGEIAQLNGRPVDLLVAVQCLSETSETFREEIARPLFARAKNIFIIDGGREEKAFLEWLKKALVETGFDVTISPYLPRPEMQLQTIFARKQ